MDIILDTAKKVPSIFDNQGAYERFFAPREHEFTLTGPRYDPVVVLADDARAALITVPDVELWFRFQDLFGAWREQRGATSSITKAALCPAYQSIIGMGEDVVPLILAQLDSEGDEPDQWFWALKAITRVDPVRAEDRGDFAKMAKSWLEWAENVGYVW